MALVKNSLSAVYANFQNFSKPLQLAQKNERENEHEREHKNKQERELNLNIMNMNRNNMGINIDIFVLQKKLAELFFFGG